MSRSRSRCSAWAAMVLGICCLAGPALAVNPAVWNFDVTTNGNDVFWDSPTNVDTGYPQYNVAYEITTLTANVDVLGNVDLIGLGVISADQLTGNGDYTSLPIVIYSDSFAYEDTTADVSLNIDSSGQGHASLTNVHLGTITILFPLQINSIHAAGTITATGVLPEPGSALLLLTGSGLMLVRRRRAAA